MIKRILFCFLLILGVALLCNSQNFKWVKNYGGVGAENNPLCLHTKDASYIAWTGGSNTKFGSFSKSSKNSIILAVGKIDVSGNSQWMWTADSITENGRIESVFYDTINSKIFISGYLQGKLYSGSKVWSSYYSKSKNKYSANGLLIRLNNKGQLEKVLVLNDSNNSNINSINSINSELIISADFIVNTSNKFCALGSSCYSKSGIVICRIDSNFSIKTNTGLIEGSIGGAKIDKIDKNVLLTFFSRSPVNYSDSFISFTDKIDGYYSIYLNHNLKVIKIGKLYSLGYSKATASFTENGEIVVGTAFQDSIQFKNKKIGFGKNSLPVVLFFDSSGNLKYAAYPIGASSGQYITLIYHGGFIYAGGKISGDFTFGDIITYTSEGANIMTKLDLRGNFLWAKRFAKSHSLQYVNNVSAFSKEILMVSIFSDTAYLNSQQFISSGSIDIIVAKIHDIEIYRGQVSKGPYCAGDTIKIPYTKDGDFNSGNQFIAQLSDADGNFTGKERELGRVTSTTDGTIKGPLPMFEVESSPNYRIRIISTDPVVQSYYKYDTLRLLIYSRDKADPGKPETICNGDSIRLSTYGGTKWTWSPKYNINDSTLKKPWVWPAKTTTYKLIIADSSGCGKPDTAFKKIIVRWPLKVKVIAVDTGVCDSKPIKLPAWFTGGDSLNYQWQWYAVSKSKKIWKQLNTGKLKLSDTLAYTPTATLYTNDTLAIVLKDNCTNKNDTTFIIIRLLKPSVITNKFTDTLVCKGTAVIYKAQVWFDQPYVWQWRDITNNSILSTTNSLSITANTTLKIKLTLTNGCTIDSNIFILNVNPPLSANILTTKGSLNDTTLCSGQSLSLIAKGKGGAGKGYLYSWIWNGNIVSKSDTLRLKPNSTSALTLILNDNCTKAADTLSKTITIIETPKADFTWDLACSRTITNFKYTGSKSIQTFAWNFNNEATSNLENPSHKFASIGASTTVLAITSSNGCTDTIKKTLDIKPQSKAAFTAADVCESESAIFINKSQDATGYNWKFGDGLKSNLESPKHLYSIGGVSQTFNVTLVAVVSGGCSDSVVNAITVNSNPISDFGYTTNKNIVDFKATQLGNTSYKWIFGNGDSAASSSSTYTYTYSKLSGKYTACLKTINTANCFSETCKTINITVGVSAIPKPHGFKIYPNPNNGSFTIEIENPSKDVSIEIFNLLGERVGRVEKVGKVNSLDLDVADGMYWVRVKNGDSVWNQKVRVFK